MLNQAIRLIRVYHDMNQADAAKAVGLSKSYVSGLEKGDKPVSISVLEKYSAAFDIPMSSLMLFAEKLDDSSRENVRTYVADKALKMLDWVAALSDFKDERA